MIVPNSLSVRRQIANQFGHAFEEKATDACCYAFATSKTAAGSYQHRPESAALLSGAGYIQPLVIQLSRNAVTSLVSKDDSVGTPTSHSFAKHNHPVMHEEIKQNRIQRIRMAKMEAVAAMQPIIYALDRLPANTKAIPPYLNHENVHSIAKVSWLNRSIRVMAQPNVVADLVADPLVKTIDIPRQVTREIMETGLSLYANQYVHRFSRFGQGISVAIIDGEVYPDHPAYKGRLRQVANFTSEDWGDPDVHATAVAGIVGAHQEEYWGMAPKVDMLNYKILTTDPDVPSDDIQAAEAIATALEDGNQIINCSWGMGPVSDVRSREAEACDEAWNLGATIVTSAGNTGAAPSSVTIPAEADGIIVVGACNKDSWRVESYSGRGPVLNGHVRPHLVAPGGSYQIPMQSCTLDDGFDSIGFGTSFAAPHVSGILALILEANPQFNNNQLKDFLLGLCTPLKGFGVNDQGRGLVSLETLIT